MKNSLALLIFLFMMNTVQSQNTKPELKISYSHVYKESSKSSYSVVEKWGLNGAVLTYSKSYTGQLKKKASVKKEKKLSEKQLESISKLLEEKKLCQNIPSPKYSDFKSPYTSIHVNLSINKAKEIFEIDLYDIAKELEKNEDYKNVKSLENLLDTCLKD